jgi:hypothetical protein
VVCRRLGGVRGVPVGARVRRRRRAQWRVDVRRTAGCTRTRARVPAS